ncbi:lysoplasmalogenase [Gemmobacter caeruleus]|uniref:lysoplasmalogenase n=1 Tax=Gemmobacter caeruleus TaxID=2595004 RepID=UPI0011EEA77C|nr:lysoplasmalogenase [Gemmobacter caeruleus]
MIKGFVALSALFAVAYDALYVGNAQIPLSGALVKTLPVALLALAGLWAGAPRAIIAGLALGGSGDFLLARPGEGAFLAGMAAFAAGHLAYAAGFGLRRPPLAVALPLVLLALSTEVWLAPHTGALLWPVRAYVLVICLMAAMALTRPEPLLRAGALFFVLSDLLLALALFRADGQTALWLSQALWPCYWLGQALILAAFLPAKPPLALPSGARKA